MVSACIDCILLRPNCFYLYQSYSCFHFSRSGAVGTGNQDIVAGVEVFPSNNSMSAIPFQIKQVKIGGASIKLFLPLQGPSIAALCRPTVSAMYSQ